jgi:hypothetical protein
MFRYVGLKEEVTEVHVGVTSVVSVRQCSEDSAFLENARHITPVWRGTW